MRPAAHDESKSRAWSMSWLRWPSTDKTQISRQLNRDSISFSGWKQPRLLRTDQQAPPNPNIRAWLPGWSHHPVSSSSHMLVRSPAALRHVIARFTALHFFHPLSSLSHHWLNRNPGPSWNMDNFNRHFPIRPDALVSSRVRTLIRRGRWLM
jgi:hypothetical protein